MIVLPVIVVTVIELLNFNLAKMQKRPLRVLYGKPATDNEFPFVVSLMAKMGDIEVFHCTGSLIDERWVLTAGHCLGKSVKRVKFRDVNEQFNNTTFRSILKKFPHPGYKDFKSSVNMLKNDIGLILIREIKKWMIGRLSALNYKSLVGLEVKYAGFGQTSTIYSQEETFGDKSPPETTTLQVEEGIVVRHCPEVKFMQIFQTMCVAPKCSNRYAGTYYGDSGGPHCFQNKIIGVTSWGLPEKEKPLTGFTPISPYLDWIKIVTTTSRDPPL